jgi:hypothetical protein
VSSVDRMVSFNLHSALSCGAVAAHSLKAGGLLVFTGAAAVLNGAGTGGMIAYGVTKAATHQLIASLAGTDSGLPRQVRVTSTLCLCSYFTLLVEHVLLVSVQLHWIRFLTAKQCQMPTLVIGHRCASFQRPFIDGRIRNSIAPRRDPCIRW